MIKAIIFDNFGVLSIASAELALKELGGGNQSIEQPYWDLFNANDKGLLSSEEWDNSIADLLGVSVDIWRSTISLYDGKNLPLLKRVEELKRSFKIGLLTNIGPGKINKYFSEEEQRRYFDDVVASGDHGMLKPQAEIYHLAVSRLEVEPNEAVFVDDIERNIAGAKDAGLNTILFKNNDQFNKELNELLEE